MADAKLRQVRSLLGQAVFGTPKGRSRTIEFQLGGGPNTDPTFAANTAPLLLRCLALHGDWAPRAQMRKSCAALLNTPGFGWGQVAGPA
eukprot:8843040-Pyramimonas_sp.AAC.1